MTRFNVFGKIMSVQRQNDEWILYVHSGNGVRSRVYDIVIPEDLPDEALEVFLDDIYHEHATQDNPKVIRL